MAYLHMKTLKKQTASRSSCYSMGNRGCENGHFWSFIFWSGNISWLVLYFTIKKWN